MPVEMATSKMIAATIEKEWDADDDQDRDEGLRGATGLRDAASNGHRSRLQENSATRRTAEK
jgi:hypothetical protein